jgi:hypothetical protein
MMYDPTSDGDNNIAADVVEARDFAVVVAVVVVVGVAAAASSAPIEVDGAVGGRW